MGSLPECPQQPGLGQTKARIMGSLGSPVCGSEPAAESPPDTPQGVHQWEAASEAKLELQFKQSSMGCMCPKQ